MIRNFTYCSLVLLFFAACQPTGSFDLEKETAAILELHNLQRQYHFEKDNAKISSMYNFGYFFFKCETNQLFYLSFFGFE